MQVTEVVCGNTSSKTYNFFQATMFFLQNVKVWSRKKYIQFCLMLITNELLYLEQETLYGVCLYTQAYLQVTYRPASFYVTLQTRK
jgi:hypothetical protein